MDGGSAPRPIPRGSDPQDAQTDVEPPDTHLYRVWAFHCARLHQELREFCGTLTSRPLEEALFYTQGGQDPQTPFDPRRRGETPRYLVHELRHRDPTLGEGIDHLLLQLGAIETLLLKLVSQFQQRAGPPEDGGRGTQASGPAPGLGPKRRFLAALHAACELGYRGLAQTGTLTLGDPRGEGVRALRLSPADCGALAAGVRGVVSRLELGHCGVGPQGLAEMVSLLGRCTSLRLSWNNLRNSGMSPLASCLHNPDCLIRELWLDYNDLGESGCRILACSLGGNRELRRLSLAHNPIGNAGLRALCEGLSRGSALQCLRLSSCSIGTPHCGLLARTLTSIPSLTSLDLDNNQLGDSGVRTLLPALTHSSCRIRILRLSSNGLSPLSALELARALRVNRSLRKLTLNYNRLGSLGARRLCGALRSTGCGLQRLELEGNGLEDDCSLSLADSVITCRTLRAVCLSRNAFTDASLGAFRRLAHLSPSLSSLWLCRNRFSTEGARRLQSDTPPGVTAFV